jgi:cell division protein FtsX
VPERQPHPIRAALLGALAGGIALGAIYLLVVLSDPHGLTSSSSTANGLFFLPFYTAVHVFPGALGGAALGAVIESWRRGR